MEDFLAAGEEQGGLGQCTEIMVCHCDTLCLLVVNEPFSCGHTMDQSGVIFSI